MSKTHTEIQKLYKKGYDSIPFQYIASKPPCVDFIDNDRQHLYSPNKQGVFPSEVWSLDSSIAKFLAPRLRLYAQKTASRPPNLTHKKWKKIVKKMAIGFELHCRQFDGDLSQSEYKKITKALKLFQKYFFDLWS